MDFPTTSWMNAMYGVYIYIWSISIWSIYVCYIYLYIYIRPFTIQKFLPNVGSFCLPYPTSEAEAALSLSPFFGPPDTASSLAPPTASPPGHRAAAEMRHKASRRPHHIPGRNRPKERGKMNCSKFGIFVVVGFFYRGLKNGTYVFVLKKHKCCKKKCKINFSKSTLLKANIVYCARESVRSAKYFMDLEIVTSCDLHTQIYYVIFDRYSCPFFKNKSRIGVLSSALGRHSSESARPSEKRRNETSFSRSLGGKTLFDWSCGYLWPPCVFVQRFWMKYYLRCVNAVSLMMADEIIPIYIHITG